MPYQETKEYGFFSTMFRSVKAMFAGILFFIPFSFLVVWYASQRELASEILQEAISYEEWINNKANKPVYITGKIIANPIGDQLYLKPGNYLLIYRIAEMYAYKSKEKKKREKEGTTTKVTYEYDCILSWVDNPEKSAEGKGCQMEKKSNPPQKLFSGKFTNKIAIAAHPYVFEIDSKVHYTSNMPKIIVNKEDLNQKYFFQNEKYFYLSETCIKNPVLGCERFYYDGVSYNPNSNYTVIGQIENNNNKVVPYISKSQLSYLELGSGSFNEVLKSIESADRGFTILLWGISVILFWLGIVLLFGPLLELIEYIPLIGRLGVYFFRFVLLVFSVFIMGIAFLILEFWYLVLGGGFILVLLLFFYLKLKSK